MDKTTIKPNRYLAERLQIKYNEISGEVYSKDPEGWEAWIDKEMERRFGEEAADGGRQKKYFVVVWYGRDPSIGMVRCLKICEKCIHYKYVSGIGSVCGRLDPPVHNVITGIEYESFSSAFVGVTCRSERYSTNKESCGIEGKFWEPKHEERKYYE